MKVRRFLLISVLLTLLLLGVLVGSLLLPKDYDVLIMFNLLLLLEAAGSWILTIVDLILFLFNKPYLPGLKSYFILNCFMIGAAVVFGIVSVIMEGGFTGSSAEMEVFYLIPMLVIVSVLIHLLMRIKKKND